MHRAVDDDDLFARWTEARFEAKLRELPTVDQAFSRAFAYIARLDEEEEPGPATITDWLYRSSKPCPPSSIGLVQERLRPEGQRAVEARLERLCTQHEQRLETLFKQYADSLPPTQKTQPEPPMPCKNADQSPTTTNVIVDAYIPQELSIPQDMSDDDDIPDFRSLLAAQGVSSFQEHRIQRTARNLAASRLASTKLKSYEKVESKRAKLYHPRRKK